MDVEGVALSISCGQWKSKELSRYLICVSLSCETRQYVPLIFHGIFQIQYVHWMDSSNAVCAGIEMCRERWKLSRSILSGIDVTRTRRTRCVIHTHVDGSQSLAKRVHRSNRYQHLVRKLSNHLSSYSYISRTSQLWHALLVLFAYHLHDAQTRVKLTTDRFCFDWQLILTSHCDRVRSPYPSTVIVIRVWSIAFSVERITYKFDFDLCEYTNCFSCRPVEMVVRLTSNPPHVNLFCIVLRAQAHEMRYGMFFDYISIDSWYCIRCSHRQSIQSRIRAKWIACTIRNAIRWYAIPRHWRILDEMNVHPKLPHNGV